MGSVVKKVGKAAVGGITGFLTGGPVGAAVGAGSALIGGGGGSGGSSLPGNVSTGNSFLDFLNNNSGAINSGLGLLGAFGAKNAGLTKPTALNDPRSDLTNQLAAIFGGGLKTGTNIGDLLSKVGNLPAYGGSLAAGAQPGQADSMKSLTDYIQNFMAQGAGQGSLTPLTDAAAGTTGPMQQLQAMAQGNPAIAQIVAQLTGQGDASSGAVGDINSLMANYSNPGLQALMGSLGAQNPIIAALTGSANFASPEQSALQGTAAGASNPYIQMAAQNPALAALLGLDTSSPEQGLLQQLAAGGSNPYTGAAATAGSGASDMLTQLAQMAAQNPGQDLIGSLMGSDTAQKLLGGQTGADFGSIADALDAVRQRTLGRDANNLREQFSSMGLRNSTSLDNVMAKLATDSETGLQGVLAQIAPQIFQGQANTQLDTLKTLLSGATASQGAGTANLGTAIQALLGAGNLKQTGAATAGQLANTNLGTIGDILAKAGSLGQGSKGLDLNAILGGGQIAAQGAGTAANAQNNFLSTITDALSKAGALGQGAQGLNLQALLGAGQMQGTQTGQNQGAAANASSQFLDQLKTMLGGAGTAGNLALGGQSNIIDALTKAAGASSTDSGQGMSALSNLIQSMTGSASALPGATATQAQLPAQLTQILNSLNNTNRTTSDQELLQQFSGFQNQQSLLPAILSFMGGGQTNYTSSGANQILSLLAGGTALKQAK